MPLGFGEVSEIPSPPCCTAPHHPHGTAEVFLLFMSRRLKSREKDRALKWECLQWATLRREKLCLKFQEVSCSLRRTALLHSFWKMVGWGIHFSLSIRTVIQFLGRTKHLVKRSFMEKQTNKTTGFSTFRRSGHYQKREWLGSCTACLASWIHQTGFTVEAIPAVLSRFRWARFANVLEPVSCPTHFNAIQFVFDGILFSWGKRKFSLCTKTKSISGMKQTRSWEARGS